MSINLSSWNETKPKKLLEPNRRMSTRCNG